jgi:hypothetical protein
VVCVETRGGNPGTGLTRNRGDIEYMVEMPVGDDDPANAFVLPTAPAKCAMQKESSADESRVEQIESRSISKDVKVERWCPDLKNARMQGGV